MPVSHAQGPITLPAAFEIRPGELVSIVGGGGKTSLMFALAAALPGRTVVTTTTRIFAAQMKLAPIVHLFRAGDGKAVFALELGLAEYPYVLVVGEVAGEKASGVPVEIPGRLLARPDVDVVLVEADGSRMRPCKAPADHEPVIPPETTLVVPVAGLDALDGRIVEVAHRPERVAALTGLASDDRLTAGALAGLLVHPEGGLKDAPAGARVIPLLNKVENEGQLTAARRVARQMLQSSRVAQVVIGAMKSTQPVKEVHKRVTAVVLAAGRGKRMGETKQLLPWGEITVLGQTLRNVKGSAVTDWLVVTGYQAAEVERVASAEGVVTVQNPDFERGEMLSSLQTAVRLLSEQCAAVLVVLADQPMIEAETMDEILAAFWKGQSDLVVPVYQGQRGNPVLIGRRYFEELLALPVGAAPRDLVKGYLGKQYLAEVSSGSILRDLDRWEEYERWRPE
jgi:molybdenum cofactor cytidylyltransferase